MTKPLSARQTLREAEDLDARRQLQIARQKDQISDLIRFLEVYTPDTSFSNVPLIDQFNDWRSQLRPGGSMIGEALKAWRATFPDRDMDTGNIVPEVGA